MACLARVQFAEDEDSADTSVTMTRRNLLLHRRKTFRLAVRDFDALRLERDGHDGFALWRQFVVRFFVCLWRKRGIGCVGNCGTYESWRLVGLLAQVNTEESILDGDQKDMANVEKHIRRQRGGIEVQLDLVDCAMKIKGGITEN